MRKHFRFHLISIAWRAKAKYHWRKQINSESFFCSAAFVICEMVLVPLGHIDTIFLISPDDLMWMPHISNSKNEQITPLFWFIYKRVHKLSEASVFFMCENRWKSGKISQHGASLEHNVCIYIFVSYCSSRYQHFCCWNKNPTETFLCSCQDCFLQSQTESLLTSCPDIIFILWAFPFACCIFSEFFLPLYPSSGCRNEKLIVAMLLMGK